MTKIKGFLIIFFITISFQPLALNFSDVAHADKVYLDITQPGIKKLSIALEGFERISNVSNTIKDDLEFTEYFRVYGPFPYSGDKFEPSLWKSSDVEIVVKADVRDRISLKIFTVTGEIPIFSKVYATQNSESMGHIIASDIYKILTGKDSPFFNRFVFLRKFKGSTGIFLSNWNGKNVIDTGIRREVISKVILRGNRVLYSSLQGRAWYIELYDIASKTNRVILKSRALLQIGDMIGDSKFIYIENDGELSSIKISDLSGKGKTVSSSRWIESSPRWYGDWFYFVSNRAGSPQIYQAQEGSIARRVTFSGRYNTEPSISPDGGKISFSSLIGGFQIFVTDLSTGVQTQITKDGNNEQPSFCPDGHFLKIMSDRRGKREIYMISVDGVIQKPLTSGYLPHCSR